MPKRKGNVFSDSRMREIVAQAKRHGREELAGELADCASLHLLAQKLTRLRSWVDGFECGAVANGSGPTAMSLFRDDLAKVITILDAIERERGQPF